MALAAELFIDPIEVFCPFPRPGGLRSLELLYCLVMALGLLINTTLPYMGEHVVAIGEGKGIDEGAPY